MYEEESYEKHHEQGECCCHAGHHVQGHFGRRFLTKTEKIERLKNYAQKLKKELAAVQERIKELKKAAISEAQACNSAIPFSSSILLHYKT